jgi:hypothetical protein
MNLHTLLSKSTSSKWSLSFRFSPPKKILHAQINSESMYGLNMRLPYSRLMIEEVMIYDVNDTEH